MPIDRDSFQRYVPVQPDRSDDSASGAPESHQQHADQSGAGLSAEALALPTPAQRPGDGECTALPLAAISAGDSIGRHRN